MAVTTLDIFNNDAFSVQSLTLAINNPPEGMFVPTDLDMLFDEEGVNALTVSIEREGDNLALVPTKARGAPGTPVIGNPRNLIPFNLLHLPQTANVMADEVAGVREFGTADQLQTVQGVVTKRLFKMRRQIDATLAYHRLGAVTGRIYDADGKQLLLDLYDYFGVAQETVDMELDDPDTNVKQKILDATRLSEDVISTSGVIRGWRAICGRGFFDALVSHPSVERAYERWNDGEFLRTDQKGGFEFAGVFWKSYYGKVGDIEFIDPKAAYLIPLGIPDLFITRYGYADYVDTVNTIGLPYYASQERMDHNKGITLESQSNPLNICTRPRAVIKLTV